MSKKKTVLRQLIESLEELRDQETFGSNYTEACIHKAKELESVNEQHMKESFNEGRRSVKFNAYRDGNEFDTFEQYYQTFEKP